MYVRCGYAANSSTKDEDLFVTPADTVGSVKPKNTLNTHLALFVEYAFCFR